MHSTGAEPDFTAAEPAAGAGSMLDLAINLPPLSVAAPRLAASLHALTSLQNPQDLLGYASAELLQRYQAAVVAWTGAACGLAELSPQRVIACHGARSGLTLCLQHLLPEGGAVLCDEVTYEGFKQLAQALHLQLQPVATDAQGCRPEALERAAEASGARVWLAALSLQNPLGTVASAERRQALAEIAQQRGLWVVEDDVYAALLPAGSALSPMARWLPKRCFHVSSVSKALAPGLAAGWVIAPPAEAESLRQRCYALGLSPSPCTALAFCGLQESGDALAIAADVRAELQTRHALAREILGAERLLAEAGAAPHLWLPMTPGRAEPLHAKLLQQGLRLTPAAAPLLQAGAAAGLRICLGASPTRAHLIEALRMIRRALDLQ